MEEKDFSEISSLPKLDETSMTIDWHLDLFDGPLNGLITKDKEKYWFEYHCPDPEGYRCYRLYRLSSSDIEYLKLWKLGEEIFQKDVRSVTKAPDYRETSDYQDFVDKWKPFHEAFLKFENRKPDAWCCSGSNGAFYAITVDVLKDVP